MNTKITQTHESQYNTAQHILYHLYNNNSTDKTTTTHNHNTTTQHNTTVYTRPEANGVYALGRLPIGAKSMGIVMLLKDIDDCYIKPL